MSFKKNLRLLFLIILFSGSFLTLGLAILKPSPVKQSVKTDFKFPSEVPLPEWQQYKSFPITESKEKNSSDLISGRHYQYYQNDLLLNIEMRYLTVKRGDINDLLRTYTGVGNKFPTVLPTALVVHRQENIGAYGLFVDGQRVYLSACINPRGESTVTSTQYVRNKLLSDVNFSRLFPWLLGQERLIDKRCLWAHLSVQSQKYSTINIYAIIKKAWFLWYQWWQPRFSYFLK